MNTGALQPSPPAPRAREQFRDGLRYAARTPDIAVPLAMMGLVGMLAYEFQVSIPVLARQTFHGGSEAYGFLTAAMGFGAVVGGLFTAARGRTGLRSMIIAGTGFGVAIIVCAFSPVIGVAYAAMLFVGWASVSFIAIGNSTIQLASDPNMRGRAIALWQVAFQGTTPIGSTPNRGQSSPLTSVAGRAEAGVNVAYGQRSLRRLGPDFVSPSCRPPSPRSRPCRRHQSQGVPATPTRWWRAACW
jgi:hypothetical protein